MTPKPRQARYVSVEGNVQGVGYRDFVRRWAIRLDVTGWVRNRCDGSVEACLHGSPGALEALIIEMRKGPGGGEVARLHVNTIDEDVLEISSAFVIRPTE